jgi:hypothetical protein
VSSLSTSQTPRRIAAAGTRAKDAAAQGAHGAREWAAPRLEDAADAITRAKDAAAQGVHGAREWAAPRLEDAADAVTASVAPRVSAALRSTARQVRPESGKAGLRRLLSWRWLLGAGAVIAAAGASAVAMRRRYASATAEVRDDVDSLSDEAPGNQAAVTDTASSEANGSDSGRVSTSRK